MPGEIRAPIVNAVPVAFRQLDLAAATPSSIAATYRINPEVVESAFEAARCEGYVRQDDGTYHLTRSGHQAFRGAAAQTT